MTTKSVSVCAVLATACVVSRAQAIDWDVVYDCDVLPSAASPSWVQGATGGTTAVSGGELTLTGPTGTGLRNSWDRLNDSFMQGSGGSFLWNDPTDGLNTWVLASGAAFTIEWRMKVNSSATVVNSDQTGMKLQYAGYPGTNRKAILEWYYEGAEQRFRNGRYSWGAHAGKTGPDGAETNLNNDGFTNIGLGEWHTYKVTSVNRSGAWHREIWLDGNYVGRWTDEGSTTSTPELKLRAGNNSSTSESSITIDYIRWADEADGMYVQAVPSVQTLLLNQSFETPAGAGQAWLGYVGDDSALVPNPSTIQGGRRWGNGRGEPGPESTQTWQTVPVNAGETVSFSGYLRSGIQGNATSSITVNLRDGDLNGALIGTVTVTPNTPFTDGNWVKVELSGQANSGQVTVELTSDFTVANYGDVAAAYADSFALTTSGPCDNPHTVTGVAPNSIAHNMDATGVVISGTNLDQADAVKLVRIANNVVIPGSIVNAAATSLTANFPTNGQPVGRYNVLVEQASCVGKQLIEAFEVVCATPTTITGIAPDLLEPPQGVVQVVISGTNLEALTDVRLVQHTTVIPNLSMMMDGANLLATFNLTDAPIGYYKVVAERSDACSDPAALVPGLGLLPELGDNLLVNGGIEPPSKDPWIGGCSLQTSPAFGASAHSGTGYFRAENNGGLTECSVEQTVTLPSGLGQYDLTLLFWGWVWDNGTSPTLSNYSFVKGEIVVDGSPVAQTDVNSIDDPLSTYVVKVANWSGEVTSDVKVRMTLRADGRDAANWGVVALDDVTLATIAGLQCNDPFADADGDGDVDQEDFAVLQRCITGNFGPIADECRCFDRDGNQTINQADVLEFRQCAGQADVPADPGCDDPVATN